MPTAIGESTRKAARTHSEKALAGWQAPTQIATRYGIDARHCFSSEDSLRLSWQSANKTLISLTKLFGDFDHHNRGQNPMAKRLKMALCLLACLVVAVAQSATPEQIPSVQNVSAISMPPPSDEPEPGTSLERIFSTP